MPSKICRYHFTTNRFPDDIFNPCCREGLFRGADNGCLLLTDCLLSGADTTVLLTRWLPTVLKNEQHQALFHWWSSEEYQAGNTHSASIGPQVTESWDWPKSHTRKRFWESDADRPRWETPTYRWWLLVMKASAYRDLLYQRSAALLLTDHTQHKTGAVQHTQNCYRKTWGNCLWVICDLPCLTKRDYWISGRLDSHDIKLSDLTPQCVILSGSWQSKPFRTYHIFKEAKERQTIM